MRTLTIAALLAACALSAFAEEQLKALDKTWTVQQASDWAVAGGALQLKVSAEPPAGKPRRPTKYALLDSKPYKKVTVEAEVKRGGRSVVIIYAYQDENHYNYAHISSDEAAKQNVHNGVFHVFNGERVRISSLDGPASLPTNDWTPVKLVFDGETGKVYVEVNGKRNPSLDAVDMSLRWGRVGLGSFNETGDFRNVKITGETRDQGTPGRQ